MHSVQIHDKSVKTRAVIVLMLLQESVDFCFCLGKQDIYNKSGELYIYMYILPGQVK